MDKQLSTQDRDEVMWKAQNGLALSLKELSVASGYGYSQWRSWKVQGLPLIAGKIALGIIMAIAFIFGVIQIIGGVRQVRNGEAEGKMGIVAGILIAGAVAIMVALYSAFGLGTSVVTPQGF